MSNEFDYDLSFDPKKKTRHFYYKMKVINSKSKLVLESRQSKKGGATISKVLNDAFFLLSIGYLDFDTSVSKGELEKMIQLMENYYSSSQKIFGVPIMGWSPEEVIRVRALAKEMKKDE